MPRSKNGTRRRERRRKIMKIAKGYWGGRSRLFKTAKEAVMKGLASSYRDRRRRKGDFRRLWIARISAAVRAEGITYSQFIHGLAEAGVMLNRKALSNMAIEDPVAFKAIVAKVQGDPRGRRRREMITLEQIRLLEGKITRGHRAHPRSEGRKLDAPQGAGVRPETDEGAGNARGRIQDRPEGNRVRHRADTAQPGRAGREQLRQTAGARAEPRPLNSAAYRRRATFRGHAGVPALLPRTYQRPRNQTAYRRRATCRQLLLPLLAESAACRRSLRRSAAAGRDWARRGAERGPAGQGRAGHLLGIHGEAAAPNRSPGNLVRHPVRVKAPSTSHGCPRT